MTAVEDLPSDDAQAETVPTPQGGLVDLVYLALLGPLAALELGGQDFPSAHVCRGLL